MFLRIENVGVKKLVGKSLKMSLTNNKTFKLWHSFMMKRELVKNRIDSNLISIQVYDYSKDTDIFNPNLEFEKWAVAEVFNFEHIPEGIKSYEFQGGLYAVFLHKGLPSEFSKTFNFIFGEWLPNSNMSWMNENITNY